MKIEEVIEICNSDSPPICMRFPLRNIIRRIWPELEKIGKEFEQKTSKKTKTPEYFDFANYLDYLKRW